MKKDTPHLLNLVLIICFILGVWGAGYIALTLKDIKAIRIIAMVITFVFYWTGYGIWHKRVFKNRNFEKPIAMLKSFLFFLLFVIMYLIVIF
jgi:hypothetical protein